MQWRGAQKKREGYFVETRCLLLINSAQWGVGMRNFALIGVCCLAASAVAADPPEMPSQFARCQTLAACFEALDVIAPSRKNGAGSPGLDEQFAKRLETFGEPAKREILKRATGSDKGWRELAGWLLMYCQSFDERDVPALIAALHADPGGGAARPLGLIGTPEAIDALVEDVRLHGAESQSGWALSQLGDRVFPYLLPLLSDDKQWHAAASIMRDMKSKEGDNLDVWLALALDPGKPERDRVGALRGIGILGSSAKQVAPQLRPLLSLNYGEGPIPETTVQVLTAMADPTVVSATIVACEPSTDPFEGSLDSSICLTRAAAFGDGIFPYANLILTKFTYSLAGADRANGASLLGYIGYASAKQRLLELLKDPDWRVVFAAIRSLGWLGAKDAVVALSKTEKSHWLADVRAEASRVISALQSPAGVLPRPTIRGGTLENPPDVLALEVEATSAPDVAPCQSGRWLWNGAEFGEPHDVRMALQIPSRDGLPAGTLIGRDNGEWGGEVKWEAGTAKPLFVAVGNVEGFEPDRNGVIVVIGSGGIWTDYNARGPTSDENESFTISNGPGGSGYALGLSRDSTGAWRVNEVARFPRAAFGLRSIGRDLFAVWSGNRAVVFSSRGIAGVAQCVPTK